MNQNLLEQSQMDQNAAVSNRYTGGIIGLHGDVLQGWALDILKPEHRPVVEVFVDGSSVALACADQFEPSAPMGDQFHGFTVQLRKTWLEAARRITARIANHDFDLPGHVQLPSPIPDQVSAVTSQIWHTGGLRVGGWVWDPRSPRRHVEVTVREGDKILCNAVGNVHTQALAYRETSDHGLAIDLPWELADGKVHLLDIVNDFGQPLSGSPIRVCCWPEGMEGLLRKFKSHYEPATFELLTNVAKEYAERLPSSVGWQHYPQWFDAFQRLDDLERPSIRCKVGLVLISEGNPALETISLESFGTDIANLHYRLITSFDNVLPALDRLLAEGCDQILPMMAGDRLARLALPHLCALLDDGCAWGFADCDRDDPFGNRSAPWFKPVWDIDLFIGADIFMPGAIYSSSIVQQAIKLLMERNDLSATNWNDFTAAVALATERSNASVKHFARVLYHRASHTAISPERDEPSSQRLCAVKWLCEALAPGSVVSRVDAYPALTRVQWPMPANIPRVSVIVPTRDQYKLLHTCIEGLLKNTDYADLEVIIVDNQSTDPETLQYLKALQGRGVKVITHPYPFNYSTINNRAAGIATGELICLLNNDIEIIDRDWLKEMVSQLCRPGVGAVGAKLLWPNRMTQHGGVVVGVNGLAAHAGNDLNETDAGYLATNQLTRRQSAVTAACLLLRKTVFQQLDGLDEDKFPVAFNDVDLCLRIISLELDIIWCASAKLIHAESASRGKDQTPEKRARALREQQNFIRKWSATGFSDRYYHPSLSIDYISGPYGGLTAHPRLLESRKHK